MLEELKVKGVSLLEGFLDVKFDEAAKGRNFWIDLVGNYEIRDNDYLLLLPSENEDYNHYSLYYLEKFLKKKNSVRAVVLTISNEWADKAKSYSTMISDVVLVTVDEVKNLLSFYCLYEFTDHLVIGSLEEPEGRMGKYIVGKNELKVSDVIKVTLYDITD